MAWEYRKGAVTIGPRTVVARTCNECGELLSGKHFTTSYKTVKGKAYRITEGTCSTCRVRVERRKHGNVTSIRNQRKSYAESAPTATHKGQPWTLTTLDRIVELRAQGMTLRQIAVEVNRTYYGVVRAVTYFGLTQDWPTREHWVVKLDQEP